MNLNNFYKITSIFVLLLSGHETICTTSSTSIKLPSTTDTTTLPSTSSSSTNLDSVCDCSLYTSHNTLSTTTEKSSQTPLTEANLPQSTNRNINMATNNTTRQSPTTISQTPTASIPVNPTNSTLISSAAGHTATPGTKSAIHYSVTVNTEVTVTNLTQTTSHNEAADTSLAPQTTTATTHTTMAGTGTIKTTSAISHTEEAGTPLSKALIFTSHTVAADTSLPLTSSDAGHISETGKSFTKTNPATSHTEAAVTSLFQTPPITNSITEAATHSTQKPSSSRHTAVTDSSLTQTPANGHSKSDGQSSFRSSTSTGNTSKVTSYPTQQPSSAQQQETGTKTLTKNSQSTKVDLTSTQIPSIRHTSTVSTARSSEQKIFKGNKTDSDSAVYLNDPKSIIPVHCIKLCNITNLTQQTTVSTLRTTNSIPMSSKTETTILAQATTQRHRLIKLVGLTIDIQLKVVANGNFSSDLHNKSSKKYVETSKAFNESLTLLYKEKLKDDFKEIVINGFNEGSIACTYSVILSAPVNKTVANETVQIFKNTDWSNVQLNNTLCGCHIDVNETKKAQLNQFHLDDFLPKKECNVNEMAKWGSSNERIECIYKCDVNKTYCGNNGECYTTYRGELKCRCKQTSEYAFYGERCEYNSTLVGVTSSWPATAKPHALSRLDIIAISAGTGGGLVVILVVALICVCRKLQTAGKRNRFYNYSNFDKEALHKENTRIENAPGQIRTAMGGDNDGYYHDMQMQQFEPEGKNAVRDLGQRSQSYGKDPSPYRKISSPDVGDVMIYQPTNIRKPAERQSGLSKFDEIDNDPHQFRKMENGAQSNPYSLVDTETNYKIRRPTVNSINSNRYS